MKFFIAALMTAIILQTSVFAANSPEIEAGNPVELLSYTSQYAKITGKIDSIDVSERKKIIFLNFGRNYNTSFSAMIYDDDLPTFAMAGIEEPAEYFKNKTVIMEGIIRVSNGKPEMVIDSPSQIRVISDLKSAK